MREFYVFSSFLFLGSCYFCVLANLSNQFFLDIHSFMYNILEKAPQTVNFPGRDMDLSPLQGALCLKLRGCFLINYSLMFSKFLGSSQ